MCSCRLSVISVYVFLYSKQSVMHLSCFHSFRLDSVLIGTPTVPNYGSLHQIAIICLALNLVLTILLLQSREVTF